MILLDKFAQHQPLNRKSERQACVGIDLSFSTLADQIGARAATSEPLHSLVEANVVAAETLHGTIRPLQILA